MFMTTPRDYLQFVSLNCQNLPQSTEPSADLLISQDLKVKVSWNGDPAIEIMLIA